MQLKMFANVKMDIPGASLDALYPKIARSIIVLSHIQTLLYQHGLSENVFDSTKLYVATAIAISWLP